MTRYERIRQEIIAIEREIASLRNEAKKNEDTGVDNRFRKRRSQHRMEAVKKAL